MQHQKLFIPTGLSHLSPFTYLLYHIRTNRFYCGYKACQTDGLCNSQTLMTPKGYTTSSNYIKEIIDEEGFEAFEIVFICHFATGTDARKFEQDFLKHYCADINPGFINKHIDDYKFTALGTKHTDTAKKKMSNHKIGIPLSDGHRQSISDAQQNKSPEDKANTSQKKSNSAITRYKNETLETKTKNNLVKSICHIGYKIYNNGKINKWFKSIPEDSIWKNGYLEGIISKKGRKLYDKVGEKSKYFKEQPDDLAWIPRNNT